MRSTLWRARDAGCQLGAPVGISTSAITNAGKVLDIGLRSLLIQEKFLNLQLMLVHAHRIMSSEVLF